MGGVIIFLCSLSTKVVKYSKTETLEKTALRCINFDRLQKNVLLFIDGRTFKYFHVLTEEVGKVICRSTRFVRMEKNVSIHVWSENCKI